MNTVLLVVLIQGAIIFYSEAITENTQTNQIDQTPREKPPQLLWDPEKRMWIESENNEEFYENDYSGDKDSSSGDFSFLDHTDNETDTIDDSFGNLNLTNIDVDCKICVVSPNTQAENVTDPVPPLEVEVHVDSKEKAALTATTREDLIRFEEKATSSIETPLNQALDTTRLNYQTIYDIAVERAAETQPTLPLEVNPVTEHPLWALEFESKRTRPLQKDPIKISSAIQNNTVGVNPQENNENNQNFNVSTINPFANVEHSSIININSGSETLMSNTTESAKTGRNDNINHEPQEATNIPLQHNLSSDSNIEYTNPVKGGTKHAHPETATELEFQTTPIAIPTNNEFVHFPTNGSSKEDKEVTLNKSNEQSISVGGQNNLSSADPVESNTSVATSGDEGNFTTSPASTTINETDPNAVTPLPTTCSSTVTTLENKTLHWPETPYSVTTISEDLCVQQDGMPVTRTCRNGVWSLVNGNCSSNELSTETHVLNELLYSKNADTSSIFKNLTEITSDIVNVTSFQIHLVSKLLEKVSGSRKTADLTHITKTVSNIMHCEKTKLKFAQHLLNSTDTILSSLDNALLETDPGRNGYRSIITKKLYVQEFNLQKTDFNGFKLQSSGKGNGFQEDDVTALNQNMEIFDTTNKHFELALLIPEELKITIKQCNGSQANPNIITTVFYDDVLFNNDDTKRHSEGKVLSVLLPGFDCAFKAPLQVIFKPANNSAEQRCAYWHYGSNEQSENIKGRWIVEGTPKSFLNTSYQLCEFSHVTHFALLVLGDLEITLSEADKKALDIITAVGSGLSLLGLLAVFITAITFRSYRSANAVVIHFSIAMAAQIILLFMADHAGEDPLMCTIFGAALHYIVLSQFCWMLTIALLQYKRYVLVFSNPTKYLIAKACVFAWGIPSIPVIIITSLSTDNYSRNSHGLCYAIGNYFIFGVLIPVAVIVFINLLVFLRIMIYIASRKIKAHRKMDNTTSLQLRLAIMLYFLLGLTWGFGLLSIIGGGVVYAYLFCITATLQGFVLFLFFIALSDKARSLWGSTFWCPCIDKSKKYDVNTDSSSHPMVRRPTSTNTSDTISDGNDMLQKYKNRSSMDF